MNYTEQLTAEEAAALRTEMISTYVEPAVRSVFARVVEVQSAVLLVSQMWCDEAHDAVHAALRFSQQADPNLDVFMQWSRAIEWEDDDEFEDWRGLEFLVDRHEDVAADFLERIERALEDEKSWMWWDSNVQAIPAFAAFCEEDCHQEMPPGRAELPYSIFRRTDAGIEMEVVGAMIRPEQDGVPPEAALELAQNPPPQQPTKRSFFERLRRR